MTEVLQASQSHRGLLLRYEAVSPFPFAMSNPDVISNKAGIIVARQIRIRARKIIIRAISNVNLFLTFERYRNLPTQSNNL